MDQTYFEWSKKDPMRMYERAYDAYLFGLDFKI